PRGRAGPHLPERAGRLPDCLGDAQGLRPQSRTGRPEPGRIAAAGILPGHFPSAATRLPRRRSVFVRALVRRGSGLAVHLRAGCRDPAAPDVRQPAHAGRPGDFGRLHPDPRSHDPGADDPAPRAPRPPGRNRAAGVPTLACAWRPSGELMLNTPVSRRDGDPDDHLHIDALRKTYDGRQHAVDGVSLTLRQGEFVTFLGPSGSGKTSTLAMVAG